MSPSRLWKSLTPDQRLVGAEAFWREERDDVQMQHVEVIVSIARRLKFRAKSIQAMPIERRAKLLAQLPDISDAVASRALIAYHFVAQRPLMGAFLDALGIAHEQGLIQDDSIAAPDQARIEAAIATVRPQFPEQDVDVYLRTLAALDPDTWAHVDAALSARAPQA